MRDKNDKRYPHASKFNLNGISLVTREITQIYVTFDIDANIILNVSAVNKVTCKH